MKLFTFFIKSFLRIYNDKVDFYFGIVMISIQDLHFLRPLFPCFKYTTSFFFSESKL